MSNEGPKRRSIRLTPTHVALGLVLLGVVLLGVWSVQVYTTARSLERHLRSVEALAEEEPMEVLRSEPEAVGQLLHDLRADVVSLKGQVGGLARLGPAFGWLPKVGPLLEEASPLLEMADGLTEAGVIVWDAFSPAIQALETGEEETLVAVTSAVVAAQPRMGAARASVEQAREAREQIEIEALPWRLQGPMEKLDEMLPLLADGLAVAEVAPELLGLNGPRIYLILAQNDDELRPTGGFISGVGVLRVEQGELINLDFLDSYAVDDYANKPYDAPPDPLFEYMGSELWLFRDANWSPDFPTSARQAAALFEYGLEQDVDGVIALNQHVLEQMMRGVGQVNVPGLEMTVTADNLRQVMYQAWNPDDDDGGQWIAQRKDFMQDLALAILDRIRTEPEAVDWLALGRALYQTLERRELLAYFEDERAAEVFAELRWDGALRSVSGDYLFVVDANVGFGKVEPLIEREIRYGVTLSEDGTAMAELALTYTHQGQREGVACDPIVPYDADVRYEAMIHRCYYDYLRVYVPRGSVLRSATAHPAPGEYLITGEATSGQPETSEDLGKTVFAKFFVVEYGETLETSFEYELPEVVQSEGERKRYTLMLRKQPGTEETPVSLTVDLPPGAEFLTATPAPEEASNTSVVFSLGLTSDHLVEVRYR